MRTKYKLGKPTVSLYAEKLMHKMLDDKALFNRFFCEQGWQDDDVALPLGLPKELEEAREDNFREIAKGLLKTRRAEIDLLECKPQEESEILAYQNMAFLADLLELNEVEQEVLRFAFHLRMEPAFKSLVEYLPKQDLATSVQYLANLLQLPTKEIKSALKKQGKLLSYNLLERSIFPERLHEFLGWGNTLDFEDFITEPLTNDVVLKSCTLPTLKAKLDWAHFEHIEKMREMMLNYLQQAVASSKKGVNLLIYGKPGTGKTELANLLGEKLDLPSYTMAYMDDDGDVIGGKKRLNNCRLIQKLLNDRKSIVIFDEIEDVFASSLLGRSAAQENKAWTNNLLENNSVPMIWLSNDVRCMDEAFLRRFDMVFEMPNLPISHKEQLISNLVGEKLSAKYVQHFAKIPELSPAMLDRTLNVVASLEPESQTEFATAALSLFNQTLTAQGFKKIEPLVEQAQVDYSLDFVSCKANIHKISEGLKRTKQGRICCYGVPGAGKTAWAKWLAEQLEMEPLVLQGSDLLDKYVGGTEQKIAAAFERAKRENMLLILDEVDTFLFARESGQRSWEHSQVNEMLTQIEKFDGLMVVSTNLLDGLDPAALRRFDLKIEFDYLQPHQRLGLAVLQAVKFGVEFTKSAQQKIECLHNLTQGDFAAVARQHRFSPFENADEWANALVEECRIKQGKVARRIGF